jgi:hypothetical protein
MFKTSNFNKFDDYLNINNPKYNIDSGAIYILNESINRIEEYVSQIEEEILKNEGNIAKSLRDFLENFLEHFIPEKIKINNLYRDFDYQKYFNFQSSYEKITELDD